MRAREKPAPSTSTWRPRGRDLHGDERDCRTDRGNDPLSPIVAKADDPSLVEGFRLKGVAVRE
jgi:hypothetical protein